MRTKLLTHLFSAGPAYTQGERSGELINTIVEGVEALDPYFSQYLPQAFPSCIIPIAIFFVVIRTDLPSGIILLIMTPILLFLMAMSGMMAGVGTRKHWRALSVMSAAFLDTVQGLATLNLLGRSESRAVEVQKVSDNFRQTTMRTLRIAFFSSFVLEECATISTAIVAVEVGLRLLIDNVPFSTALFVLLLAPEFFQPLRLMKPRFWTPSPISSGDVRYWSSPIVVRVISPPIIALIIGLVMYFILGAYNIRFALVLIIFMLLGGIVIPVLLYWMSRRLGQRLSMARAALNTALVDSIQGVADLLIFDRRQEQLQRTLRLNHQLIQYQALQACISGLREGLDIMLSDGCTWVMLIVAIPLVRTGQLKGVYLALILLAALSSFESIRPLANAAQQLGNSLAAARRLFAVVDEPPAVRDPQTPASIIDHYDIDVRHLTFRYPEQGADAIKDLDFSVKQGQRLAIVGPSGAGKSTLASLLVRFWEYEQGSIKLGGQELHALPQQDIHRYIGVVEQQPHLFNGTMRENLLLGRPDATQEQIEQAAKQALLHDFIQELPRGYETRIGEQGVKLSGGERQRLAIARVILKDAPVLILDEATAHLDTLTEGGILDTLSTFMHGRTTIIITHRLVGLEQADEILVMRDGRTIERGLHHELLQIEGLYWQLWTQQQQVLEMNRW